MNEYILLIRNEGNPVASLSQEKQKAHIQKVGGFIQKLVTEGKMKAALPLETHGVILTKKDGELKETALNAKNEVVSGYYHILAKDLQEATAMAKSDPRFEDGNWKIEIRPIMKVEGIS